VASLETPVISYRLVVALGAFLVSAALASSSTGCRLESEKITPGQAAAHVGKSRTVCGQIIRISRGADLAMLIDIAERPAEDTMLTIVIREHDRDKFSDLASSKTLGFGSTDELGRRVCVTGLIQFKQGGIQIAANDARQIQYETVK